MSIKVVGLGLLAAYFFFGRRRGKGPISSDPDVATPPGEVEGDREQLSPTERS